MNNKSRKRKIREALGLPSDDGRLIGAVSDDSISENTMTSKCGVRNAECGMRGALNGQFDCGASGGATSPNTEVNADHQSVIDETLGASGGSTLPNTKESPKGRTLRQDLPNNSK